MSTPKTTLGQKILLASLGPIFFFLTLEAMCRLFGLPERLRGVPGGRVEMPKWIETSDRSDSIQAHLAHRPESMDWMKLFQPGRGYRVHLVPNRDEMITNTFSLISADRQKEYRIRSNSLGFRGSEITERKAAGVFRILIFGDSSSFGWGVDDGDTYAAVLERALEAQAPGIDVEVGNFAVPGDSSEFGRLVAERMLPRFSPDLVIFGFGANDAHMTYTPHQVQIDKFRHAGVLQDVRGFLQESAFISTLTTLADRRKTERPAKSRPRVVAVPLERYESNLASLLALGRANGARKNLVFAICAPGDYRRAASEAAAREQAIFFDGQDYLTSRIQAIKSGEILPDLVAEMRAAYPSDLAKNDVFYITNDGCHPNRLGYRLLGEALAARIAPIVSEMQARPDS